MSSGCGRFLVYRSLNTGATFVTIRDDSGRRSRERTYPLEAKAARAVEAEKAMADMTKRVKRVSFECVLREACTRESVGMWAAIRRRIFNILRICTFRADVEKDTDI